MAEEPKTNMKEEDLTEVVPTLYIALGGTGAEVLWRIRRRILNSLWATNTNSPVRIDKLTEFPYAEFLHIDLDANTVTESGKAAKTDILSSKVAFNEEERFVKKLDMMKYIKTDQDLAKYPLIQEWFPLNRAKLIELNIDPENGAGQIRCISRLYCFDRYQEIKTAISTKADRLRTSVKNMHAKSLGLDIKPETLKIVVVASTAGGTGSGSFLDMGFIARIASAKAQNVTTDLALMLPTGYIGANAERTQANTYAALMELETSMRQGSRFIKSWSENEIIRDMPETPYDNIYFLDTENLAGEKTGDIKDLYDMVADALFEDFSTAEFANKKRSISINQKQHKIVPYLARVDREKYGDMQLRYSRTYSTFGQATIDIHLEQKQNVLIYRQVGEMLKSFFGVSNEDSKNNIPTEKERDELLANRMYLGVDNEIIDYEFVTSTDLYRKGVERTTFPIVSELLRVKGVSRLDDIEKKITDDFEEIRMAGTYKEWPKKIIEAIAHINHDTFKGVDSGSGLHEDAVKKRREELLAELMDPNAGTGLIKALWARVDNKERGGLDYTIELIQRIKDRIENSSTGLIKTLQENAKWFSDLSGHLRNAETTELQNHLQQAIHQFLGLGSQKQSEAKLNQISESVRHYVRYHLYAVACREAVQLMQDLSDALGKKQGTDSNGNPVWSGFIGQLEMGRSLVRTIVADVANQIDLTNEAMKQGHAMYRVLPAPKSKIDELELLSPKQAREWAEQAFKDFDGSQKLFAMLKEEDGRAELLGKLRNRALAMIGNGESDDDENPLFAALDQHANRGQLFSEFMRRAMPWVAARLDKYLKEQSPEDQYKCYIGVKNHKKFEALYGNELRSQIPTGAVMTSNQIAFVEIDQPGKLVCYIELTGIPIGSLKALGDWYNKYRVEDTRIPTHVHRRTSTFVHPIELTSDELSSRAEDLKLFIQAVAVGVLSRIERGEDVGRYQLTVKGSKRNVGDEKLIRLNGFDSKYRHTIEQQVDADLLDLKNEHQLAMWVALLETYNGSVYPLRLVDKQGVSDEAKALPTLICERLVDEWRKRLENISGSATDAARLIRMSHENLLKWTEEIPGSLEDVYPYEVNINECKPKRVLKREVLKSNWVLGNSAGVADISIPPPAFSDPNLPPPLVQQSDIKFHISIGGNQYGPYGLDVLKGLIPTGQLNAETLVWRPGLTGWIAASQTPELAVLFLTQSNVAPPPLPS